MKALSILGFVIVLPLVLVAGLASMALVVFALSISPILLVLGTFGAAAYGLQQAFCESCRSRRPTMAPETTSVAQLLGEARLES